MGAGPLPVMPLIQMPFSLLGIFQKTSFFQPSFSTVFLK